jgi:hypothetical protein
MIYGPQSAFPTPHGAQVSSRGRATQQRASCASPSSVSSRWSLRTGAFLLLAANAQAAPLAEAVSEGVTVTLTDEACALTAVSNLPLRATWDEGVKRFEGCYGASGALVVAYWDDRSVTAIPVRAFKRVTRL